MTASPADLVGLVAAATRLARVLEDDDQPGSQAIRRRLQSSVLRPLTPGSGAAPASGQPVPSDDLWELAKLATELCAASGGRVDIAEAAAALQDLALAGAGADEADAAARADELAQLQSALETRITVVPNGPYLVANASPLVDWLGRPGPVRPLQALCRCGHSQIKPLCDGSHATSGFTDDKDPNRVPDRRDIYVGQQVTILDNRGTCQHAGFCTDRLATVFRSRQEPFVAPSGGRMDEIIRAVRDCPSGALSYAIDSVEARDEVDHHGRRPQQIAVTKDGPYRVTGALPLVNDDGTDVARNDGASTEHFALCRCGHSQNKPFCSGMHWYVDFHDPVDDPDAAPTIFEWAGGFPALLRMTRLFYEKHVPQDPLLAPLFATMSADHPERVAAWLGEVFCGPKSYSTAYGGYARMLSQHLGKGLTDEQRTRWVTLLLQSAKEAGLPNDAEFRSAFSSYIEWGSRLAVENSQTEAKPPEHMPMPHWDWNTAAGPPGARVSALAGANGATAPDEAVSLPAPGQPVSFAAHVKTMFRARDRRSMQFAFDLWDYDDVTTHGDAIMARLKDGTMPCDGVWPADWVDAFERWMAGGKAR